MTLVNVTAFLISLAAIGAVWKNITTSKLVVFLSLFALHFAASYFYYLWSKTATADASIYYYDIYSLGAQPWAFGTPFLVKSCQLLKHLFAATYLDCFLLFQSFGFAGLMIMARVFEEIQSRAGVPERSGAFALLFLPSVNFWTSAIGKDAPIFFAISLAVWAMLSLRQRFVYFGIALGIMVLFRAHIAFMAATALAGTALFGSSVSYSRKLGLFVVALAGIWITKGAVQSTLGIDATSVSSVTSFIDQRNSVFSTVGGTTAVSDASYPVKLASLLFRPMFFDSGGGLGIVASVENLGVIAALFYIARHWRDLARLARHVAFIRFVLLFGFIILVALSLLYYNVGLGLRERVMVYPMVYSVLVALWAVRRKHLVVETPPLRPGLMVQTDKNRILPEF